MLSVLEPATAQGIVNISLALTVGLGVTVCCLAVLVLLIKD